MKHGETEAPVDGAQLILELLARPLVEGAQGLVEQQRVRLHGERPCQRDALPLAARQRLRLARQGLIDPQSLGQGAHGGAVAPPSGPGQEAPETTIATHLAAEGDVAGDVEVRKEQGILPDETDAAPLGRQRRDLAASDRQPARSDAAQAGDRLEEHALAGAAAPHNGHVLAVADLEVEGTQREIPRGDHDCLGADHGELLFPSTRRTAMKTANATRTMSSATGWAASRPKPSKRSNTSTGTVFGL